MRACVISDDDDGGDGKVCGRLANEWGCAECGVWACLRCRMARRFEACEHRCSQCMSDNYVKFCTPAEHGRAHLERAYCCDCRWSCDACDLADTVRILLPRERRLVFCSGDCHGTRCFTCAFVDDDDDSYVECANPDCDNAFCSVCWPNHLEDAGDDDEPRLLCRFCRMAAELASESGKSEGEQAEADA